SGSAQRSPARAWCGPGARTDSRDRRGQRLRRSQVGPRRLQRSFLGNRNERLATEVHEVVPRVLALGSGLAAVAPDAERIARVDHEGDGERQRYFATAERFDLARLPGVVA